MNLPTFKYHPDPEGTGSVITSDAVCVCCETARGYLYTGPAYAIEDYRNQICPWCIADGSAHSKLDVTFTCEWDIGLGWHKVSADIVEVIAHRTPGFQGWEQSRWWTHCGDASAFLGRAGYEELKNHDEGTLQIIRDASLGKGAPDAEWDEIFPALNKDGAPRAYLFQCLHCSRFGGYADFD